MQSDSLPPGWEVMVRRLSSTPYYHWTDPKLSSIPDIYVTKSKTKWKIDYWIRESERWMNVHVPLTPEPPLELAETLYYAAQ